LLHAGWAGLGNTDLPETIFLLDYAPYAWLLPRMAAVIHHGGSGTTGFALRSGVPSMVIPFTSDQPFWGWRSHKLGVGPAPIPFTRLTAANLTQAITHLVSESSFVQRAAHLRMLMADEAGVPTAVAVIDRTLRVGQPTP
jgi:UDP:flavonoid glycosyltransferase YjiC (YdhE family)